MIIQIGPILISIFALSISILSYRHSRNSFNALNRPRVSLNHHPFPDNRYLQTQREKGILRIRHSLEICNYGNTTAHEIRTSIELVIKAELRKHPRKINIDPPGIQNLAPQERKFLRGDFILEDPTEEHFDDYEKAIRNGNWKFELKARVKYKNEILPKRAYEYISERIFDVNDTCSNHSEERIIVEAYGKRR